MVYGCVVSFLDSGEFAARRFPDGDDYPQSDADLGANMIWCVRT